jgi:hypothetical protein
MLDAAGVAAINKAGTTQLRLTFPPARSGGRREGTVGWSSGNRRSAAVRPELVVTYVE